MVRLIIVRDKNPSSFLTTGANDGIPELSDVIATGTNVANDKVSGLGVMINYTPIYTQFSNRFQVLLNKLFVLNNRANYASGNPRLWKKRIRVMLPCYFSATGLSNSLGPGQIYAYLYSSQWTGAATADYFFSCRMSYTDV